MRSFLNDSENCTQGEKTCPRTPNGLGINGTYNKRKGQPFFSLLNCKNVITDDEKEGENDIDFSLVGSGTVGLRGAVEHMAGVSYGPHDLSMPRLEEQSFFRTRITVTSILLQRRPQIDAALITMMSRKKSFTL